MIEITHILCPVDFSAGSRHALIHAVALARWYKAKITVLNVFEIFVAPEVLPSNTGPMAGPFPSAAEVKPDVERFVAPFRDAAVPIDIAVEEGHPARKIVAIAKQIPADLIVMGTHGRSGVERLMLGSVTEKVLRLASCPVLIVPPSAASSPAAVRLERILCPIDFGPSSTHALKYALSLAQETDANLFVLHALETFADKAVAVPLGVPEYRRLREEQAREELHAAIPADVRDWCHPVELLAHGKPYQEILRAAHDTAVDLIVMGVAGRGPIEVMLFGSTTNQIVRRAKCSVLTIRERS